MNTRQQFTTFYLDGQLFGIDVSKVQEVMRFQEMTAVPLAQPVVQGLINLRGQIVTALDLRRRLRLPKRQDDQLPMNVIVHNGEEAVSFLVDEIGDVLEVEQTTFEPPPETLRGEARELIRGAYKLSGRLLMVLDAEKASRLSQETSN